MTILKNSISFLSLTTIILTIAACSDDDLISQKLVPCLEDCHNEKMWDSLATHNQLIGEWAWFSRFCMNGPDSLAHIDLKVEFFENGSLERRENGDTIINNWRVDSVRENFFQLDLFNASVEQLSGIIKFCESEISFDRSPSDGCENFFRKIE